jgi:hypothetical protein
VEIYTTHERVICPRHKLWIGDGTHGIMDQFSVRACPDITAAWHHHKNLISQHGRSRVRTAFHTSSIINWRWYSQLHHFTHTTEICDALMADQPRHGHSQAIIAASLYPSIVSLTAAIASPYWAKIAHLRQPDLFLAQICNSVTDGWSPTGAHDPLRRWMDATWHPGFHGSDTIGPSKPRGGNRNVNLRHL